GPAHGDQRQQGYLGRLLRPAPRDPRGAGRQDRGLGDLLSLPADLLLRERRRAAVDPRDGRPREGARCRTQGRQGAAGGEERTMTTTLTTPPRYRTLADLLKRLGDIPPERVRLEPAPGQGTVEDVLEIHARERRLCELVDGVLVEKAMG